MKKPEEFRAFYIFHPAFFITATACVSSLLNPAPRAPPSNTYKQKGRTRKPAPLLNRQPLNRQSSIVIVLHSAGSMPWLPSASSGSTKYSISRSSSSSSSDGCSTGGGGGGSSGGMCTCR